MEDEEDLDPNVTLVEENRLKEREEKREEDEEKAREEEETEGKFFSKGRTTSPLRSNGLSNRRFSVFRWFPC